MGITLIRSVLSSSSIAGFPPIGCPNTIYVDLSNNALYIWDGSSYQLAGSSIIDGIVDTYADLPPAADHNGEIWLVTTDVPPNDAGLYVSNGSIWTEIPIAGAIDSVQGTANQILVNGTAGSQETGNVILTLPNILIAPGTISASNLSGTNTGNVTIAGEDYLSLAGQVLTADPIDLSGSNATGILAAGRFPSLSGDLSNSAGSLNISVDSFNGGQDFNLQNIYDAGISGGDAGVIQIDSSQPIIFRNNSSSTDQETFAISNNLSVASGPNSWGLDFFRTDTNQDDVRYGRIDLYDATRTLGAESGIFRIRTIRQGSLVVPFSYDGANNILTLGISNNITKLANLTTNGFVKTSSGDGTLLIDTSTYIASGGAAGGDLSGTYPNPVVATFNTGNAFTLQNIYNAPSSNKGLIGVAASNPVIIYNGQSDAVQDTFAIACSKIAASGSTNIGLNFLWNNAAQTAWIKFGRVDVLDTSRTGGAETANMKFQIIKSGSLIDWMSYVAASETLTMGRSGSVINIPMTTASRLLGVDGSKNLTSIVYTDANTASAVVQRDGSGNFTANQITLAALQFNTNSYIYNSTATQMLSVGMTGSSGTPNGAYFQVFGNNHATSTQRGGAEFVVDTRNSGTGGFTIFTYNGTTWTNRFKVDVSGNVNISGLTASSLVATDSSKNLTSSVSNLTPQFLRLGLSGFAADSTWSISVGTFGVRFFDSTSGNPRWQTVLQGTSNVDLSFEETGVASNRFVLVAGGNVSFNSAGSFGGGTGVIFLANRSAAPSSNPTGGGILYAESGAGKWRGTSGTTTTFAVADPHCKSCGMDFAHEWENEEYGGTLQICNPCKLKSDIELRLLLSETMRLILNGEKPNPIQVSRFEKFIIANDNLPYANFNGNPYSLANRPIYQQQLN